MTSPAIDDARRRLYLWVGIVLVALVVIVGYMAFARDTDNDPPAVKLSTSECDLLQAEFDEQSEIADLATPGGPGAQRATDRMDALDRQMRDGGCYG